MKILFVSGLYPPLTKGGGEISTHLIAKGLVERGHEVQVIAEGKQRTEHVHEGVKVLRASLGLLKKPLLEKQQSKKIARRLRIEMDALGDFDIVHAHDFRSALALSESGLPGSVVTVRDYAQVSGTTNNVLVDGSREGSSIFNLMRTQRFVEAPFPRNFVRLWQYAFNVGYRQQAFRRIRNHVYISNAVRDEISEKQDLSGVRSTVIYNPVPDNYLNEKAQPGRAGSVLYAGRVEDYKGVRLLLKAWEAIAADLPHGQLRIVGEGAQRAEYEKWVAARGLQYTVRFDGFVPWERLIRIYDEATVFVAPHVWTEPFGRTVAEAMARGKVVVTANTGGPAEIVEDGRTGTLFERNSVEDLARTLREALGLQEFERNVMGRAAHRWVGEHLAMEKISGQYEEFYTTISETT